MKHSLLALLILSTAIVSFGFDVKVTKEWKYVDFTWDNSKHRIDTVNAGRYSTSKCLLYDVDKAEDGRLFVTTPNEQGPGSPATLATVTTQIGSGSGPLLRPYPNWGWHSSSSTCNNIVNVARVHILCNHIFVLDNGKTGTNQVCNPKLLIFNLKNDTLVQKIDIPPVIANNRTGSGLLVTPFVYVPSGKCDRLLDEMIVFMADTQGSGIVIYDSSTRRMCRVESDCMKPTDPHFSIAGQNFTYNGGISSMTVIGKDLYYAPAAGKEVYKIKICTLLECPNKERANKQSELAFKLSSQTGPITSVKNVIVYSNLWNMSIIYKNEDSRGWGWDWPWNWNKKGNPVVLAQDSEKLQSINGLKYLSSLNKIIYLSNRHQVTANNKMTTSEMNFRYGEIDWV
ncbi:PREDICTED: major royal jelly protein 3-like [Wasmannia auropunctata]|uniref:major royal jelly protein 3-like n=1 Tax=Wasmannia auropunctata TaxID=64793 RepID=UPI0005EFF7E7|nr:PREDICTED: major royal jelly protein 3-like [Wasmannia auropunctata]XP_011694434.1 PREDICTED: major royal jelly protein 3-like [Wasmannia auropunctata]XP_011694435.1 PREDICTED: major royal jelly protein 3-like [Wasmannia auropunctata]